MSSIAVALGCSCTCNAHLRSYSDLPLYPLLNTFIESFVSNFLVVRYHDALM